ncbi:MAG: IS110 family transposase [Thermodesulforhabdaceae bacterium]
MNHYRIFVGIDVAKDSFTTTLLYPDRKLTFTTSSNVKAFEKKLSLLLKGVDKKEILVLMEHTGVYHLALAEYLHSKGYDVAVINPYSMRKFAEAKMCRAKTDRVDSVLIAEYGRQFFDGRLFNPKTQIQRQIEIRLKMIEDFQKQVNRFKNQREALRRVPMTDVEEYLAHYDEIIEVLENKIKQLKKEVEKLCKENYPREYKLLESIPGIKTTAISLILSTLRGFEGFKRAKEVGSFVGICPSPYESGSTVKGRGSIRKRGNAYARKIFYLCALSAIRANRYCREFYERLLSKGKAKKQALVAVAYKLIRQAFGVLKSGVPFREDLALNT